GRVFPPWSSEDLNMADKMAISSIARVAGSNKDEVITSLKKEGDLGSSTEYLLSLKRQSTLFKETLTLDKVYSAFEKIASSEGIGSVEKKLSILSELISNASPEEAKYIVRTVLGQLRIGVGEGIVRDAISTAFNVPSKLIEASHAVLNDFGEVAELASKGERHLIGVKLRPGRPLQVMLYPKTESVSDAIEKLGDKIQAEYKYDGFRTQIHKTGDEVKVFTRRLEDVTTQFPDIAQEIRLHVSADEAVFDSESVGVAKDGSFVPFQTISQRIKRKYGIHQMVKNIPIETHLFDILYLNGKNLIDLPLKERLELLKKSFTPSKGLRLVDFIQGNQTEVEAFYEKALGDGVEGLMLKSLDSPYKPGQRVGKGYKLKPKADSLELVVTGAEWGEGKRANWLSSYILAARYSKTGELKGVGRMATGMTESQMESLTNEMKKLVVSEKGKIVELKPTIVMEVAYQELQKSSKYSSGFALRFPRLVRVREDRGPEDIDTVERIQHLFEIQFKKPGSR
ncbi:MAG: ATP-dependent DNA ligase, partial [Candidatus Altiarchaeota archaeon]|nr:ATP-dependent DNA ligase [Candidatus Altiarchaeota archaeon]